MRVITVELVRENRSVSFFFFFRNKISIKFANPASLADRDSILISSGCDILIGSIVLDCL